MTEQKLKQQAGAAARRADGSANIALIHEVWRQAHLAEEPFRLPCGSVKEANSMRVKLYNAVRNVKKFPEDYPGMVAPVNDVEIVKDLQDESVLILRRKELSPLMVNLRKQLEAQGIVIADSALRGTPQTREIAASMDRLLGQLHEPADSGHSAAVATSTTVANPLNPEQSNSPPPPLPGGHNPFFSRE